MPTYEYECAKNGEVVAVRHAMHFIVRNWGELCFAAQIPLGDTDFEAVVKKRVAAPAVGAALGDSTLRNAGFTKLVKRDAGVYENVTATGDEARYMKAGDPASMPHLHKKVGD